MLYEAGDDEVQQILVHRCSSDLQYVQYGSSCFSVDLLFVDAHVLLKFHTVGTLCPLIVASKDRRQLKRTKFNGYFASQHPSDTFRVLILLFYKSSTSTKAAEQRLLTPSLVLLLATLPNPMPPTAPFLFSTLNKFTN